MYVLLKTLPRLFSAHPGKDWHSVFSKQDTHLAFLLFSPPSLTVEGCTPSSVSPRMSFIGVPSSSQGLTSALTTQRSSVFHSEETHTQGPPSPCTLSCWSTSMFLPAWASPASLSLPACLQGSYQAVHRPENPAVLRAWTSWGLSWVSLPSVTVLSPEGCTPWGQKPCPILLEVSAVQSRGGLTPVERTREPGGCSNTFPDWDLEGYWIVS